MYYSVVNWHHFDADLDPDHTPGLTHVRKTYLYSQQYQFTLFYLSRQRQVDVKIF